MNVLVVHNQYRERGGEDRVVELERGLLQRRGHRVIPYILDNRDIEDGSGSPLGLAARTVWNHDTYRQVRALIARERPEVMHVHNTLPLASPSVYYAARAEGVGVVHTLHNYRLICPNASCLRDGQRCTACVGSRTALPGIAHGCYRGSRSATAAVAAMVTVHHAMGTWQDRIDAYIAPTEFTRRQVVAGGLPADRIIVKPHFVDPDPGAGPGGGYALFVGRLAPEKGIDTLLAAWRQLGGRIPLRIVGDGPLAPSVAAAAAEIPGVTWLGRRERPDIQVLMAHAAALVFPSIAFETFGQTIIEAYAAGTPVVVSDGGAAAELVDPGRTGVLARSGDAAHLAMQVISLFGRAELRGAMRAAARGAFQTRYTASPSYESLMAIYGGAAARAARRARGAIASTGRLVAKEAGQ